MGLGLGLGPGPWPTTPASAQGSSTRLEEVVRHQSPA